MTKFTSEGEQAMLDPMSLEPAIRKKYFIVAEPTEFNFIPDDTTPLDETKEEIFYKQKNPFTKEEKNTRVVIEKETLEKKAITLEELEQRIIALENILNAG